MGRVAVTAVAVYVFVLTLYPEQEARLPEWLFVPGSDAGRGGLAGGTALVAVGVAVGMRWLPLIGIIAAAVSARPGKDWSQQLPVWIPFAALIVGTCWWTITWQRDDRRFNEAERYLAFSAIALGGGIGGSLASTAFNDGRGVPLAALLLVAGVYCGVGVVVTFFDVFARGIEKGQGGEALIQAGCASPFLLPIWPILLVSRRRPKSPAVTLSEVHAAMVEAASSEAALIGTALADARSALASELRPKERVLLVAVPTSGAQVWLTDQRLLFVSGRSVKATRGLAATVGASHRRTGGREGSHWLHLRYADGRFDNLPFGRDSTDGYAGVTENSHALRQIERAATAINNAIAHSSRPVHDYTEPGPLSANALESAQPTTPAGWYEDPWKRAEHRYWNGSSWESHVQTRGVPGTDEPG